MSGWFDNLFSKKDPVPAQENQLLELEREIQSIKLELAERDTRIARLQAELERSQTASEDQVNDRISAFSERLIEAAAAPASQLMAQAYLLEVEGKPLQAKDILAVARRLVDALNDTGMRLSGSPGEEARFNPEVHALLASTGPVSPGTRVRIRFPGVSFNGKIVRKAGVDLIGEDS